jgi:hypothetical protein
MWRMSRDNAPANTATNNVRAEPVEAPASAGLRQAQSERVGK